MNTLVLSWSTWLISSVLDGFTKVKTVCSDVARLYTESHLWFISDNGIFADSCYMDVWDKKGFWVFDGKLLVHSLAADMKPRRLPYLSAEMKIGLSTISLDTFFEEVRYSGEGEVPFPVLMAACMIYEKSLYDWHKAHFKVILRNGDEKTFVGIPEPA